MDNKNEMSLLIDCEDCKEKFRVQSSEVTHKKEFKVNGESIFLTYFDCPSCGRRHFVQIDDKISLDKMKNVQKTFIKFSVMKRKGKAISEKQSEKFRKARKDLSEYRNKLMRIYTDKLVHDNDTDSNFALRFTLC